MRPIFVLLLASLLVLAGCGGPDGEKLLKDASPSMEATRQAIDGSRWAEAAANWQIVQTSLTVPGEVKAQGRLLSEHLDAFKADIHGRVASSHDRWLSEAQSSREKSASVNDFIANCADPATQSAWVKTELPAMTLAFVAAEEKAKAEAERAAQERRARAYLVVIPSHIGSNRWKEARQPPPETIQFRTSLLELLRAHLAPIPVEEIPKFNPDDRCAGTVSVGLMWKEVNYGGQMGIGGTDVPTDLTATITILTPAKHSNMDGVHSFVVTVPAPGSATQWQLMELDRENRKKLFTAMQERLKELPTLADSDSIIAAAAEAAAKPLPAKWVYSAKSKSVTGNVQLTGHDWSRNVGPVVAAMARRLGGVRLVDKSAPGAGPIEGEIVFMINAVEVSFGDQRSSLKTIVESVPITMSVDIEVDPKEGTVDWKSRHFAVKREPPKEVARDELSTVVVDQGRRLMEDIARQIDSGSALSITQP